MYSSHCSLLTAIHCLHLDGVSTCADGAESAKPAIVALISRRKPLCLGPAGHLSSAQCCMARHTRSNQCAYRCRVKAHGVSQDTAIDQTTPSLLEVQPLRFAADGSRGGGSTQTAGCHSSMDGIFLCRQDAQLPERIPRRLCPTAVTLQP